MNGAQRTNGSAPRLRVTPRDPDETPIQTSVGHLVKHGLEIHESLEDSNKLRPGGPFPTPFQKLQSGFFSLERVFARGKTQT